MRRFLVNISWSFVAVLVNASVLFIINIIAGRVLGPASYGKYSLVLAITATAAIVISFGFDTTAVRFIAQAKKPAEQNKYLSNTAIALIPASLLFSLGFFIFRHQLAELLRTDTSLVLISLAFALLFAYENTLDGFIKGLEQFRFQAIVRAVEAVVVTILFVVFVIILKQNNYQFYILALGVGSLTVTASYCIKLRKRLRSWDRKSFQIEKPFLKLYLFYSIIGLTLTSTDKFFVARYLGARELGIYSAYLVSSVTIASQLVLLLNNVFFPMVNQVSDKLAVSQKIDRLAIFAFIPFMTVSAIVSYLVLRLFGSQYEIHWPYILLVNLVSFLQILATFYVSIVASSQPMLTFSTKIYSLKPLVVIGLYALAYTTHSFTAGAVFSVMIAFYLYDIFNAKIAIKYARIKNSSTVTRA